jgi:hypothetical protein
MWLKALQQICQQGIFRILQNNGSAESRTQPGHPIGSFFGYEVEGLYQSDLDILKSPPASSLGSYRPGDFKFKDVNGDGVISSSDRTFIGNPLLNFTMGFNSIRSIRDLGWALI